jgi:hypothetical protein
VEQKKAEHLIGTLGLIAFEQLRVVPNRPTLKPRRPRKF